MKKSLKIVCIVLLAIILLLIITPFAFKGKIKGIILKEVNNSLNASVDAGKVNISLIRNFPNAYISISNILIAGMDKFEGDTLMNIGSLAISTSIMDLIVGSPYEIKKISIENADVRLRVLADGKTNWDIVKASESSVPEEETGSNFRLLLKSLTIKDSRMIYDDNPNATYVVLEGLNHSLSGDLGADFTRLKTQTNIQKTFVSYDGIKYLNNAVFDWKADLDADLVKYIYTFRENKLIINDFPIVFDGTVGMPDDGYELQISFATPESSFKSLLSLVPAVYAQEFASVKADGKIGFDGFVKGKYTDEQYPAFLINLDVQDAWFQYPGLPAAVNNVNIDAKIESPGGDVDNTLVDIANLTMNFAGNPVMMKLLLKNPMTDPYIDTRIKANINLSDFGKFYPLEKGEEVSGQISADITLKGQLSDLEQERYSAFEAAGYFNTSGVDYTTSYLAQKIRIENMALNITPAYLDLTELRVKSGNSDFIVRGKLENYLAYYLKDEKLKGNFNLRSLQIDVNELLTSADTGDEAEISDTSAISAFIVPPGIDFTLDVSASKVKYMDYDISNLNGIVKIKDQKLILDGISMNGMGGKLELAGSYATSDPESPLLDFNLDVKEISIQETFRQFAMVGKFAPVMEKIIGDLSGNIKLSGLLDQHMMPKFETMTGAGNFITSTLRIANVNTLNQLSSSLQMDQLKELQVAGARIIVELLDGVMEVKPFDFNALGIDMNLAGQTSIDQKIGYDLKMKIPRSMMGSAANKVVNDLFAKAGQAGANVQPGDYINVDALIDGTITDPKVRLNLAGTGKDMVESVKEQVQEQVEQKVEELKEDAKEEAEKIIQEADRQAQAILDQAQKQSQEMLKTAQGLADEAKKQANANADKIIREAKGEGYVAELAAKKSAEEVRKQGDKQAQKIMDEANKTSASLLEKARQDADKIKAEARKKVNQ